MYTYRAIGNFEFQASYQLLIDNGFIRLAHPSMIAKVLQDWFDEIRVVPELIEVDEDTKDINIKLANNWETYIDNKDSDISIGVGLWIPNYKIKLIEE